MPADFNAWGDVPADPDLTPFSKLNVGTGTGTRKRHHYLSVTYMEGFTQSDRLWVYRSDAPECPHPTRPTETGFANYYHSFVGEDGVRDNHQFEDLWGRVETVWPATRRALHTERVSPAVSFNTLGLTMLQRVRVPAARDRRALLLGAKLRAEVQALERLGRLPADLQRYASQLDTVPVGINPDQTLSANIERLLTLCKLHLELHAKATDETTKLIQAFVKDAETAILERVAFVDTETDLSAHAVLLQKLGRRGVRKSRSKIFTTNYDLCFEEAGARHRFTFIDGFSHSLRQVYDRMFFDHDVVRRENGGNGSPDYIENVVQLYKLHGSIDWRRKGGDIVRSQGEEGEPVLIYPRSSKYQESFEAPYLDMIGAFQAALREPDTAVIVSGFGFNDDHISRPILSAAESNMSLRLIVCDPVFLDAAALPAAAHTHPDTKPTDNRFLKSFIALAAGGDARIHLINGRFEDMAVVLPDLMGETDRERHVQRIRSIREELGASTV